MIGSQQGLPLDHASTDAFGHKLNVNRLTTNTHPIQIPILSMSARALSKWYSRTILKSVRSWRAVVFQGAPVDSLGSSPAVAACLRRMRLTFFWASHTNP